MEIYLVGGAVRDKLLGLAVKENDWLVVGATPEQMIDDGFRPVGKDFPVFLHPTTHEEYALARTERKVAPGYQGFTFHADETVTLEQDLLRRDLTINAMVENTEGKLLDPLNGQQDLNDRRLRHVSAAFSEDPVRILRVARFLARFAHLGFSIADETLALMQSMVKAGEVKHLVAERVWQECDKALGEKNPECFLEALQRSDAIDDVLPGFDTTTLPLAIKHIKQVKIQSPSKPLCFAAMVFSLDLKIIESLCERLAVPNTYRDLALLLKEYHQPLIQVATLDAKEIVNVIQRSDAHRKKERFALLLMGACILNEKNNDELRHFWQVIIEAYLAVDPQVFIKNGLQKAELGKAIAQQRLDNVQALKKSLLDKGTL